MQVFISCSHKDEKFARELCSRLSEAGVKVWLAEEKVLPGDNLALEAGKALERSDAMVVLLSPDAVESFHVRSEITYALSSPRFESRVIPVILKPTKGIPWFLQTLPTIRPRGTDKQLVSRTADQIVEFLLGSKGEELLVEPTAANR